MRTQIGVFMTAAACIDQPMQFLAVNASRDFSNRGQLLLILGGFKLYCAPAFAFSRGW